MKGLAELQKDIAINESCFDCDTGTRADYPDNDWGIMLAHYDWSAHVYRFARVETKEQSLRRDHVTILSDDDNDDDWIAWNEDNPNIPTIPHNPVIYKATLEACRYFSDPPLPLRNCLSVLANGGELPDDDWPYFVLMYAEFRGHFEGSSTFQMELNMFPIGAPIR
jgi:hypothetical protein